jgi:hypothetical protein
MLHGTIEWPATLEGEPFIVIRADDAKLYHVDITSAQRRGTLTPSAGTRVTVAVVEGQRPYQLLAVTLIPGDDAEAPAVAEPAAPADAQPVPTARPLRPSTVVATPSPSTSPRAPAPSATTSSRAPVTSSPAAKAKTPPAVAVTAAPPAARETPKANTSAAGTPPAPSVPRAAEPVARALSQLAGESAASTVMDRLAPSLSPSAIEPAAAAAPSADSAGRPIVAAPASRNPAGPPTVAAALSANLAAQPAAAAALSANPTSSLTAAAGPSANPAAQPTAAPALSANPHSQPAVAASASAESAEQRIGAMSPETTGQRIAAAPASSQRAEPAPAPVPPAPAVAMTSSIAETHWRVEGTVESVDDMNVILKTPGGKIWGIDVSTLSWLTRGRWRPGDRITLFGEPRADLRLVANGALQYEIQPAGTPTR